MRLPIATKLALLVVPLVLIPLVGLGFVWYSSTRAAMEVQIQEELQARLLQVGLRLRPFLRERELDLYDLASSSALADYDTQVEYRLLQEADVALRKLAEHLEQFARRRGDIMAEVRYLDQRGRELVSATPRGVRKGGADSSRMPFFQRARGSRAGTGPAASVERSEALGIDVLRLALPTYNKWEEFRGLIVLDIPMSYFAATLTDALAGRPGTGFLLDEQGTILGPHGAVGALGAAWAGPRKLASTLRAPPKGPQPVNLTGGGRGLLVREAVGVLGWSVGILAPLSETEERVRALTRLTLTYGVGAALVLVLAVTLVTRGASRRVRRLQAATAQLAQGNFELRVPAEVQDELGDLGRSFNIMAESLARRDAEVQARTEEVQRRRQELEVLNTVINAAHTSLDLKESLEAILDRLLALLHFLWGAVRLYDEANNALILAAHKGLRPNYAANPIPLRMGEGHMGLTLRAGRPMVFNDPTDLAAYRDRVPEGQEVGGLVFIPILMQGQPLGAIALGARRRLDFTEAEMNLLASIGLEVGTAIQNARLFSQTQALLAEAERHRAHAEALAEIGRSVTATLDLDRVLDLVVERAGEAVAADAVGILRWDSGVLRYIRACGWSNDPAQLALSPGEDPNRAAALARVPVWTTDLSVDPRFKESQSALALLNTEGVRAILAAPIILGAEVWGVFSIHGRQPHEFSLEEVRFAAAVAQQAAIAIENARLYTDLQAAYGQLKAAQEQALQTEKLRALGQMAGGVAHDFNNLLAAILGRVELLQQRTTDPDVSRSLTVIRRAALDGAETVRRILGFARAKGEEKEDAVEVGPLLHQVVDIARPRWKDEAHARGVVINVRLVLEPAAPIRGNPAELREVFLNLLFNAVDAMPAGGTITLGVRQVAGRNGGGGAGSEEVQCFIRDTGVGMPDKVRRRAFDPFFTTKGIKGTGLGLSVVYGIVSRHNGTIEIDSSEGAGTTVTLHLPIFCGPSRQEAQERTVAPTVSARILVVDDEEDLADMLADILRLEGGHTVEVATDPRVALGRLSADGADLLVTDLGMPVLSGWELAAQARALRPALPVILVTGWGHDLDPEQVVASGIAGVVAKPYRIDDIREAVASALATSRSTADREWSSRRYVAEAVSRRQMPSRLLSGCETPNPRAG